MATIITKNSSTASSVPLNTQLVQGELAVNVTDKRLFTENASGTVVELGTNPSSLTLPNGTANGVAYLNGSKVLTTGSALTFDGTNFGVGTASVGSLGTNITTLEIKGGATDRSGGLRLRSSDNSVDGYFYSAAGVLNIGSGTATPFAFLYGGSEQMRLTSTGLGIGTSSPLGKMTVRGLSGYNLTIGAVGTDARIDATNDNGSGSVDFVLSGSSLKFNASGSERARIDSSGNLLVGTTDSSRTSGGGVKIYPGANGDVNIVGSASTNGGGDTLHIYSTGAGAYRFYVGWGGTIYATSATITALSDQRLKENIRDLDDGLGAVMALKPRKFDWKAGKGKDVKGDRGFIAQEFEQVFPDMIDEWRDPAPDGEEAYKSVNANLIPTLVKAIQEQQTQIEDQMAIINQLKTDVAALKAAA